MTRLGTWPDIGSPSWAASSAIAKNASRGVWSCTLTKSTPRWFKSRTATPASLAPVMRRRNGQSAGAVENRTSGDDLWPKKLAAIDAVAQRNHEVHLRSHVARADDAVGHEQVERCRPDRFVMRH